MKRIWWWAIPLFLNADESFITQFEYGKMLYENPRGIGCVHCHGKEGNGSLIATYKHKGTLRTLLAPPINELPYERFSQAMLKNNGIMPRYYLESSELRAIHLYLKEMKRPRNSLP